VNARSLLVFLLLSVPVGVATGQKNCRKGIRCGNSCIAANKTCRIGGPATTKVPETQPDSAAKPGTPALIGDWVGSSIGSTYYRAGCSGARKLSPKNLIYFKTEEEAQKHGRRRSVQKGC